MEAGDWILLSLTIAATIPFLFANGVILCFRNRKYFKDHGGVALILLGSASGLLCISSSFVTNGHISKRRSLLANCVLWGCWLKLSFGLCFWLICIILRLGRMNNLHRQNAPRSIFYFLLLIPVLMIPNLLCCAAASLAHSTTKTSTSGTSCKFRTEWTMVRYFTVPPLYFVGVVIFLFKLKNKQENLRVRKEYWHTVDFCVMTFLVYVLTGFTYITKGSEHVSGRCFLTFCVCCLVFMYFWVPMARPVYLCLFRPESEMDQDEVPPSVSNSLRFPSGRFSGPLPSSSEGAILHALNEACEQIRKCKERINELRQEKSKLQAELHAYEP